MELSPCCPSPAFSSCGEQGLLSSCGVPATHRGGCSYCGAQGLKLRRRSAVVNGFNCPAICEVFPDRGLKLCPLHWQADSYPLYHQFSSVLLLSHEPLLYPLLPQFLTFLPLEYLVWSSRCKLLLGGSRAEWDPSCIAHCVTLDKPPHLLNGSDEKDFVHSVVKVR